MKKQTLSLNNIMTCFCLFFLINVGWGQMAQNPVKSPEIHEDNSVTFRIRAAKAEDVKLSGTWMAFMQSLPMIKSDSGVWSLTIDPLPAELYGYNFVVDGVNTLDPVNFHVNRDGTWRTESVLFISGEGSKYYEPRHGPKGTLSKVWYNSPTLEMTRRMYVYTPPAYNDSNEDYPVLYLLHGGGGDEDAWTNLGRAPNILDNLIAEGKALPMIVVMTNGNPDQASDYTSSPKMKAESTGGRGMANQMFEKSLVNDVIPFIEKNYRVKKGKNHRALTGLSMGGLQTMNTTFMHPELFDYIGVMSMGFADLSRFGIEVDHSKRGLQIDSLKKANPKLYWIACGKDDFLYDSVVTMRNELDQHNFPYTYRESTGGHTWSNWRIYLTEFAPMLFR